MNNPRRTNGLDARKPLTPELRQKLRAFAARWQNDAERLKQVTSWRPARLCDLEPSDLPQEWVERFAYQSLLNHAAMHGRALSDIAAQLLNFGYELRFDPLRFDRVRHVRLNSTTLLQVYRAFAQYRDHWQSFQTLFGIVNRILERQDITPTKGMRIYKDWQEGTSVGRMNVHTWDYLTAGWTVRPTVAPDLIRSVIQQEILDKNEVEDEEIDGTAWISIDQDPTQSLFDVRRKVINKLRKYRRDGHKVKGSDGKYRWLPNQPLPEFDSQQPASEDPEIGRFLLSEGLAATIRAANLKGQNAEMAEILRTSPELASGSGANIEIARRTGWTPGHAAVVKKRTLEALRKTAKKDF